MLLEYINEAMAKALYDKLEDGSFFGKIPQCPGVVAFAETLYKCEQVLRSSLEGCGIADSQRGTKSMASYAARALSTQSGLTISTRISMTRRRVYISIMVTFLYRAI